MKITLNKLKQKIGCERPIFLCKSNGIEEVDSTTELSTEDTFLFRSNVVYAIRPNINLIDIRKHLKPLFLNYKKQKNEKRRL